MRRKDPPAETHARRAGPFAIPSSHCGLRASASSRRGTHSDVNQDSVFVNAERGVFVLADGLGGRAGGEVASAVAVESIGAALSDALRDLAVESSIETILLNAIRGSDEAVRQRAAEDRTLEGMGATLVAVVCRVNRVYIAHVGDSRGYAIHEGAIRRLTDDHSVVAELMRQGRLSPAGATRHRLRHLVTRYIGDGDVSGADIQVIDWNPNDVLLLCSDGLTVVVPENEIQAIALATIGDAESTSRQLVERAVANGARDDVTVIVIHLPA